jgi:hypothetical protein
VHSNQKYEVKKSDPANSRGIQFGTLVEFETAAISGGVSQLFA